MPVDHYENFPVASALCPPALRAPIAAIYQFARTADDIADEGDATPAQRLADLVQFRADLHSAVQSPSPALPGSPPHSGRWPGVFDPLPAVVAAFALPVPLLEDLLSAFEQDVRYNAEGRHYATRDELLDYCRRSANPIGRLLLHLYGIDDPASLAQSDCICTALQLINFWQDLSVDIPRGRFYLPANACSAMNVSTDDLSALSQTPDTTKLIASEAHIASVLMHKGSALAKTIPGRAGWELRLVVQGGLRILDKMAVMNHATLQTRPKLRWPDVLVMLWRAVWM